LSRPLSSSPTFFTSSSSEVPATSSKSSSCSSSSSSSSSSSTSSSSSSSSKRIRRVPEDEDFPHRSPFDYHDRRGENLSPTRTSCKTIRRKKKKIRKHRIPTYDSDEEEYFPLNPPSSSSSSSSSLNIQQQPWEIRKQGGAFAKQHKKRRLNFS